MARAPRKQNGHRWRGIQARVYVEEDRCGICGYRVDKSLPRKGADGRDDPRSKSVDHIVPVARGGAENDRSNCQLAHLGCNFRKNDGRNRQIALAPEVVSSPGW